MTPKRTAHVVHGRPGPRREALDAVASRGLLTWWDLMSDLDPDWLSWSEREQEAASGRDRAA